MEAKVKRAQYGAAAASRVDGKVPKPFPRTIGDKALTYLKEIVDSGFTCGMVGRFEKAFAEDLGVKHCITAPGCTTALAMLALAFDFAPGDEVICSPVTDYGSVYGLIKEHYIPVFVDTAPGTVNLSAETIAPCITDRTRAILVVHKTGLIPDMDPINALAEKHGLIVYEDVCQAPYSEYRGQYAGTLSKAAAFSFDYEKTLASDMGGCVVTNDDELAERLRFVGHSRGGVWEPGYGRKHILAGHGYRMAECTAAICLAQLDIIHDQVAQRDRMIRLLSRLVGEIPGITPLPIPDYQTVYSPWIFGFTIDPEAFRCSAWEFGEQLHQAGIPDAGGGKYYLMPAALTFLNENAEKGVYPYSMPPASRRYTYSEDNCPNARDFLANWVRWASFCEKYQPKDCETVAAIVREVADRNRS